MEINFSTFTTFLGWLCLAGIVLDWFRRLLWPMFKLVLGNGAMAVMKTQIPDISDDDRMFLLIHTAKLMAATPGSKFDYFRISRFNADGEVSAFYLNVGNNCPTLETHIEITNPLTDNTFVIGFGYGPEYFDLTADPVKQKDPDDKE